MSRQSSDQWLTNLVRATRELRFDELVREEFDQLRYSGASFKNCYRSVMGWQCKQFLAGGQRVLGCFANSDAYHAVRYADCMIAAFWKYRKTDREAVDSDFTFTRALAENTLANHPIAGELLGKLESWLQQNYNLRPYQKSWHKADRPQTLSLFVRTFRELELLFKRLHALTPDTARTKHSLLAFRTQLPILAAEVRMLETHVTAMDKPENTDPTSTAVIGQSTTAALGQSTTAAPLQGIVEPSTNKNNPLFTQ